MAEYLIQNDTLETWAGNARRIAGTEDEFNAAEIAEIISRTEGTIKSTGEYQVRAFRIGGDVIKSGMYDTGEVFALPKNLPNSMDLITQPDGTKKWETIATFDGWTGTAPIAYGYTKVEDMPINIGALFKPVDDCICIVVNIENAETTIVLNILDAREIDWGDGNTTIYDSAVGPNTHTHTYNIAGKFLIKIPNDDDNYVAISTNLCDDAATSSIIEGVVIPKWLSNNRNGVGLYRGLDGLESLEYILFEDGCVFSENRNNGLPAMTLSNCTSLEHITLPNSIVKLSEKFLQGSGIKNVILPNGITYIPQYCFRLCTNLTDIIIPDSVTEIGYMAFSQCTSLENITLSKNLVSIDSYVFDGCSSLKSLIIPGSVTNLEIYALAQCPSLESVVISNGISTIPGGCFYACNNLKSVTVPESVTTIGYDAFESNIVGNTNLKTVILPNVTSIGPRAFSNRYYINLVLQADTVCSIQSSSIELGSTCYVPDNLVDAYKSAENWSVHADYIKPLSEYIAATTEEVTS